MCVFGTDRTHWNETFLTDDEGAGCCVCLLHICDCVREFDVGASCCLWVKRDQSNNSGTKVLASLVDGKFIEVLSWESHLGIKLHSTGICKAFIWPINVNSENDINVPFVLSAIFQKPPSSFGGCAEESFVW